ncbi:hypothetical protein [Clostridium omnivorum]|uniref:ABC transporter permease n=1 Tax=Clostridium omnivorum TaxID=1604902 RepID=A0ABQ5N2C8_9CLOT|nr:hypothetical protein [Clostridium sp. E14]GLC29354.1 hypothetical protein bsdE14_07640 [Clostridium sp. E14]
MNNIWKLKFVAFIHSTSVFYKRLYFTLLAITIGAGLLSLFSLIGFINKLVNIVRTSPNGMFITIVFFVVFPVLAFMLDKSFAANVHEK